MAPLNVGAREYVPRGGPKHTIMDVATGKERASNTLALHAIPRALNEQGILRTHFSQFGDVLFVNSDPGKERGFVQFRTVLSCLQAKNVSKFPVLGNRDIKCSWAKFDLADPANYEDRKPDKKHGPDRPAEAENKSETKEELAAKLKAAEDYKRRMEEKLELQKRQKEIAEAKAEAKAALLSKMRATQEKKRERKDGGEGRDAAQAPSPRQEDGGHDTATPASPAKLAELLPVGVKKSLEEEKLALLKRIAAAEVRKKKKALEISLQSGAQLAADRGST